MPRSANVRADAAKAAPKSPAADFPTVVAGADGPVPREAIELVAGLLLSVSELAEDGDK